MRCCDSVLALAEAKLQLCEDRNDAIKDNQPLVDLNQFLKVSLLRKWEHRSINCEQNEARLWHSSKDFFFHLADQNPSMLQGLTQF